MANEPIGVTETSATGQDSIVPLLQSILASESVLLPAITDYSGYVKKGDKSVSIPRSTRFSVASKVENTNADSQKLTFSVDEITLNKYEGVFSELEDRANVQATPDVEGRILQDMGLSMVEKWETDVATELYDASTATPDHVFDTADGYGLKEVDILEAKRLLDVNKVKKGDRYMGIYPDQTKEVLQISNFIQQDRYPQQQALMNGEIGMTYGFKVLETAQLTADQVALWHKSHVGFAAQMDMEFEVQRAPLERQAWQYSLYTLYGVTELDSGERGVLINCNTA